MYEDLLPLLVPGFLTARMRVGSVRLGLRSLTSNDLSLLREVAKEGGPEWPLHLAAASVWMVNGIPLLEGYPYSHSIALNFLNGLHKSISRAIFAQALGFFRRMRLSNQCFESFLYEEDSRRLWKGTNNGTLPLWTQSGIPGLDRLGLNPFQASWVQWNRSEDERHDDDFSWSLTKVLVSVQSSKSAKKLDGKDKVRADSEKSRRVEVQNLAYYKWLGLVDEEGKNLSDPSRYVHQPRTALELSEEMRRWVAGEKDFHDQVVDEYKNRVRSEFEAREAAKESFFAEARKRRQEEESVLGVEKPRLVAFTKEDFQKRVPHNPFPGARFINENDLVSRTYNRYLREVPDSRLEVENGRVVYSQPSTDPEESKGPSLNDRIANRKPRLNA